MAEERVQRRLAAILATDVAGFSRLMGDDETGTLTALKKLRADVIDPIIAGHRGRIVKLMGDGALIEFASVADAVECAVGVQRGVAERNADLPESKTPICRKVNGSIFASASISARLSSTATISTATG